MNRKIIIAISLLLTALNGFGYTGLQLEDEVRPFLEQYCYTCHGEEKQKGDRRFDELSSDLSDDENLTHWQDILDLLNLGDMPPEEAELRPEDEHISTVVAILTSSIAEAHELKQDQSPQPVLRRLNRREYLNTVRDLFGFNMTLFDPTTGFPEDDEKDGFDNLGATLVTSSYLLENYLDAADQVIERAFQEEQQPEVRHWKFHPPLDYTTDMHSSWIRVEKDHNPGYTSIFQGTHERFGYRPIDAIKQGVPHDGYYQIRIKAAGLNRKHPWDENLIGTDTDEPIRLGVVSGKDSLGRMDLRQAGEQTLASFNLPDDKPEWVEGEIWLDKGFLPRLTYENGPYWFKGLPGAIHKRWPEEFPIKTPFPVWWEVCQTIRTPQIRIYDVELSGPYFKEWPPAAQKSVLGNLSFKPTEIEGVLKNFSTRAFRRPVLDNELKTLAQLYQRQVNSGEPPFEAFKTTLKAILCSPDFLYLPTGEVPGSKVPEAFQLASRLSYFLWSSMPDKELMELAAKGKLSDPNILKKQALRMLADPKGKTFSESFTDRWLTLYKLGEMPPDHSNFENYYVGNLEKAMRTETHLFFDYILHRNLDISNFIQSDFTFINRPLAKHYGWDRSPFGWSQGRVDNGFKKVALPDNERGGLFGQASILTVTANGIDTSPVIRGVWVLNNILGAPPSPPPPDVEPLEPDIRGATTIREQLQKHRKSPTCAECHSKIDPLGFALEGFNAVGGLRNFYDKQGKVAVDTSGNLPDGTTFEGIKGLRSILSGRKEQFARCLTDKLLTYATGRQMTIRDRPHIDAITTNLKNEGYGLQDLVLEVVSSEPFRITGQTTTLARN